MRSRTVRCAVALSLSGALVACGGYSQPGARPSPRSPTLAAQQSSDCPAAARRGSTVTIWLCAPEPTPKVSVRLGDDLYVRVSRPWSTPYTQVRSLVPGPLVKVDNVLPTSQPGTHFRAVKSGYTQLRTTNLPSNGGAAVVIWQSDIVVHAPRS